MKALLALFLTLYSSFALGWDLIAVGDTGTGQGGQYEVAIAMRDYCRKLAEMPSRKCDIGILLGDNFYPNGVKTINDPQWISKFERPYEEIPFRFMALLGNHDYSWLGGDIQAQIDYTSAHWAMPNRFYLFKDEGSRSDVFVIDSEKFNNNEQLAYLKKSLSDSIQAGSAWRIVAGHHPVYSYGFHGDTHDLKEHLSPLLERYKVAFYFSGHDHDMQVLEADSMTFVVCGSGAKARDTKIGDRSLFAKGVLGFCHLEIESPTSAVLRMVSSKGDIMYQKSYTSRS